MFEQVISSGGVLLMRQLSTFAEIRDRFYLVGGTALALQCGHRRSETLDLFTSQQFEVEELSQIILSLQGTIIGQARHTLHAVVNQVKLSFLYYPYPLLKPCQLFANLSIACIEDVACMKVIAILQGGEKKDFYDMYEILKRMTPRQLKQLYLEKYTANKVNCYYLLKSFFYFEEAEKSPEPMSIDGTTWTTVKKFFLENEHILTEGLMC